MGMTNGRVLVMGEAVFDLPVTWKHPYCGAKTTWRPVRK